MAAALAAVASAGGGGKADTAHPTHVSSLAEEQDQDVNRIKVANDISCGVCRFVAVRPTHTCRFLPVNED